MVIALDGRAVMCVQRGGFGGRVDWCIDVAGGVGGVWVDGADGGAADRVVVDGAGVGGVGVRGGGGIGDAAAAVGVCGCFGCHGV